MIELTKSMHEIFSRASLGEDSKDAFELRVTVDPLLGEERLRALRIMAQAWLDNSPVPKITLPGLGIYCEPSPFLETHQHADHQAVIVCCGSEAIRLHQSPWVTNIELLGKGEHIIEALKSEHKRRGLSLQYDMIEFDQETQTGEMWDGVRRHSSQTHFFRTIKEEILKNWDNEIISLRPKPEEGGSPAILEPA